MNQTTAPATGSPSPTSTPIIRPALPFERAAVLRAYIDHFALGCDADGLADCEVYIRDNYMTDSPGYVGPVAIIHWAGSPGFLDALTLNRTTKAWRVAEDRREA